MHACVTHSFSVVSTAFAHAEGTTVVALLLSLAPHNGAERITNNELSPLLWFKRQQESRKKLIILFGCFFKLN